MKWLNIFIESVLIFLILFSPLIYAGNRTLPLTIIEASGFLLLFIYLLQKFWQGKFSLVRVPLAGALVSFIALIVFQLIPLPASLLAGISPNTFSLYNDFLPALRQKLTLSIYPEATISYFLEFLCFLGVFFVVLNYTDEERKAKRLVLTIIFSGCLYALYGLIRLLVTPTGLFSTFGNRDHFAAYMELVIPLCVAYAFIVRKKSWKAVIIFFASVMSLALVFTLSRAGMVCISLSLLLFIFLFRLKKPLKKGLIAGLALLLILGLFLSVIGTERVSMRLATLSNPLRAMTGRIEVLKNAPALIKDFPVFGTGLNTFGDIFHKYEAAKSNVARFAHNEPLQLLIETGFLGFILIILFLLFYFRQVLMVWLKRRHPFAVYLTLGCFMGLISVSLHSFLDFFMHIPAVMFLFFVILALMFRIVYIRESQNAPLIPEKEICLSKYLRPLSMVVLCILFVSAESLVFRRYQAEAAYSRAKFWDYDSSTSEVAVSLNRTLKEINRAINLNPLNSSFYSLKADLFFRAALRPDAQDIFAVGINDIRSPRESLSTCVKLYKQAINLNPTKSGYHFRLGLIYNAQKNNNDAAIEFKHANILDPQNARYKR